MGPHRSSRIRWYTLYIYFRLSSPIISIQIFMKTKQKSSKEKNRAESRALNHGAFLSQYLNGFCFLFINERHGFLEINRMVFCSFTETQKKSRFHPEETEYENKTILKK